MTACRTIILQTILFAFLGCARAQLQPTPDAILFDPPGNNFTNGVYLRPHVVPYDPTVEIYIINVVLGTVLLAPNATIFHTCATLIPNPCWFSPRGFRAKRPGYDFGPLMLGPDLTIFMNTTTVPPLIQLNQATPYSNATATIVDMNPVEFSQIRYTTDGTPVTSQSPEYASPVPFSTLGSHTIRAAEFIYTADSVYPTKEWAASDETALNFEISVPLHAPVVEPPSGDYERNVTVSVACGIAGVEEFISMDNQTFVESDSLSLSVPWSLNGQATQLITIYAQCRSSTSTARSAVVDRVYALRSHNEPSPTVMNPPAGLYLASQFSPTITCEPTATCRIFYTTDSSVPSVQFEASGEITPVNSTRLFTGHVDLDLGITLLSSINVDSGWYSPRAYRLYDVQGELSDPTFDPPAGTVANGTLAITISSAEDAVVHYYIETSESGPPTAIDFGSEWTRGSTVTINASSTIHVILQKPNYQSSVASFTSDYILQQAPRPNAEYDKRYFLALLALLVIPIIAISIACVNKKNTDRSHVDQFISMGFDIEAK